MITEAFVYCWTDHKTNKLYVGSHKGSLNDGYVCSSKVMLEQYNKRPCDFTRQIIAKGQVNDIRKLEYKILSSIDAATNESFYNKHNGFGSYLTEEMKDKIGRKSKERWKNSQYRSNVSQKHKERHYNMCLEKKKNIAEKLSAALKDKPKTEEHKISMRGKRPHVNQSGRNNNNAVDIETPYGFFESITEAANTLNIKYDNLWYKLRSNKPGWRRII